MSIEGAWLVANSLDMGHQYSFHVSEDPVDTAFDVDYDTPSEVPDLGRASIWTMIALEAPDQLRQRMAWALAQIFVVAPDDTTGRHTEMFVNFYDIFVRHAFGNFADILREVTYSPVMGDYLTYKRNRAFDSDGAYPDENYAREIMQLFTIGLWQLNPDGTRMLDSDGNQIPTYSNE
ncbi:bPT2, partial [Symbiodinium pilosum]